MIYSDFSNDLVHIIKLVFNLVLVHTS